MLNKFRKEYFLVSFISVILFILLICISASAQIDKEAFLKNIKGLGIKPDGTPLKVGIIMADLSTEWSIAATEYPAWILEQAGATVVQVNAEYDLVMQANKMDDFVTMGMDVIIIQPVDDWAIAPKVIEILEKGVEIFCINHSPMDEDGNKLVRVGTVSPHRQEALIAAQCLAEKAAGQEVRVGAVMGDSRQIVAIERDGALFEVMEKHPNVQISQKQISYTWGPEEAFEIVQDFLTVDPDLFGIWSMTNGFLPGVLSALEQNGKLFEIGHPDHVVVVSMDGSPVGVQAVRDGYLDINPQQCPYTEGLISAKGALMLAQGVALPEIGEGVITPKPIIITRENVDDESLWGNYGVPKDDVWPGSLEVWREYRFPGDEVILDRFKNQ